MKVGISISFSSGFPGGGACAGRFGAPPTSAGFPNPGAHRRRPPPPVRNGSNPGAGAATPAQRIAIAPVLVKPVAMTVIRTSPCSRGSFTAPKMISAHHITAA